VNDPDYVAPTLVKGALVLHIRNRSRGALLESPGQEATIGTTICGQAMFTKHAWLLMDLLPGDRVCERCIKGNVGERRWGLR
jgi:hypothetical protein